MNHIHTFPEMIYNIYQTPTSCKIMTFILCKNLVYGFHQGMCHFTSKGKPITYLYESILVNLAWGCVEIFFWPITFPYSILDVCDFSVNFIRDKMKK
jgi:hypothetical protein